VNRLNQWDEEIDGPLPDKSPNEDADKIMVMNFPTLQPQTLIPSEVQQSPPKVQWV